MKLLTVSTPCRDAVILALANGNVNRALHILQQFHPRATTAQLRDTLQSLRNAMVCDCMDCAINGEPTH